MLVPIQIADCPEALGTLSSRDRSQGNADMEHTSEEYVSVPFVHGLTGLSTWRQPTTIGKAVQAAP